MRIQIDVHRSHEVKEIPYVVDGFGNCYMRLRDLGSPVLNSAYVRVNLSSLFLAISRTKKGDSVMDTISLNLDAYSTLEAYNRLRETDPKNLPEHLIA